MPAFARTTDPDTSHTAAASLDWDTVRQSQLAVLVVLAVNGPMTDEELVAQYLNEAHSGQTQLQSPSGIRTRRKELERLGAVRDSGSRRVLASGRSAIVWEVDKQTLWTR